MAYKSILTIVTDAQSQGAQIDAAVAMARREDAHLDVLCIGIDRTQTGYYYAGATAFIQQETFERAQAEAAATEASVRERLAVEDIRWGAESAVAQLGAMGGLVALRARFADLVVQLKPYGAAGGQDAEAIVEAALFEGRAPVLIVPEGGLAADFGRRIVCGWNQGQEALNAIRAALPMLRAADLVDVAIIDPPPHGAERADPGASLCQMLVRHGAKAEVTVLAKTLPRVSDVLMRHVSDINGDMVVMGAYGHSRFREAIMGGATRNMLEQAKVPVLMAH
ncbi:MAG: universal stress protein [Rhodobacteraceae bacterium]|nr:universal stress protein [Paracoccaceae bacterium]